MSWATRLRAVLFPLVLIGAVVAAIVLWPQLRVALDSIERLGRWTAPLLLALQVVQVVLFVIPGEVVQIAAGYLFGVVGGSLLSLVGIAVGSVINYAIGRVLGAPFLRVVTTERLRRRIADVATRRGVRTGFYLLFVVPGIPKDVLGYVAGAAADFEVRREPVARRNPFGLGPFLLFSMIGRSAGIVGSAVIGASAAAGYEVVAVVLLIVSALVMVLTIRFQTSIEGWIAGVLRRFTSWD